jgi:hypothetical protein
MITAFYWPEKVAKSSQVNFKGGATDHIYGGSAAKSHRNGISASRGRIPAIYQSSLLCVSCQKPAETTPHARIVRISSSTVSKCKSYFFPDFVFQYFIL